MPPPPTRPVRASTADLDYLEKVIAGLNELDQRLYYSSADALYDVQKMLRDLGQDVAEKANKLLSTGDDESWKGEGANAFSPVIDEIKEFLGDLGNLVAKWYTPVRTAGEDIVQTRNEVNEILAKYSQSGSSTGGTPRQPQEEREGAPLPAPAPPPSAPPPGRTRGDHRSRVLM